MLFKTIVQGRIEFGTQKAYDMAIKMFNSRAEKYYKNDILFLPEDIFFEEELMLNIPRMVQQCFPKALINTSSLLEYIVQFGISGELNIWQLDEGKILHHKHLEPSSDKVAVQQFLKGRGLVRKEGMQEEAIKALDKAISKHVGHAQAYERRAKVCYILEKYHDAIRDYNKSIALDPNNPYAYYGKAKALLKKDPPITEESIESLGMAIKKSVALQQIHWKARRLKGNLHLETEQYEKAEFELRLFTKRIFPEDNPNYLWNRQAYFNYGKVLMGLEKYSEAVEAFDSSIDLEVGNDDILMSNKLRCRGVAKQNAGQNGHIKDLKDAADMGDKQALELLGTI